MAEHRLMQFQIQFQRLHGRSRMIGAARSELSTTTVAALSADTHPDRASVLQRSPFQSRLRFIAYEPRHQVTTEDQGGPYRDCRAADSFESIAVDRHDRGGYHHETRCDRH